MSDEITKEESTTSQTEGLLDDSSNKKEAELLENDYPETPASAPTHDYHTANKKYVDDQIDLIPAAPVKATGAEVNTGTNDTKFVTPKAITDSDLLMELSISSDTLQLSSDAEVTGDNAAYTKLKELTSTVAGKIKTKFDLKQVNGPNGTIAGKIYVNGVAVGDEHTHTLSTYTTYTDTNIDVDIGDLVQVYVMSVDSPQVQAIQNFRLYYDESTKAYIDAVEDQIINVPTLGYTPVASANTRNSDDGSKQTAAGSYTKIKEILLNDDLEACRIYFVAIHVGGDTGTAYARIYKNGVAIGAERNPDYNGGTGRTYSEDFAALNAVSGDLIQIYGYVTDADYPVAISNFRLQYDAPYQLSGVGTYTLATALDTTTYWVAAVTNQDP